MMEICFNIERLDLPSSRRTRLESWLINDVQPRFAGRILPVTSEISDEAGRMLVAERKAARTPHIPDFLIAATAKVYGMTIATLNRTHFETLGVKMAKL